MAKAKTVRGRRSQKKAAPSRTASTPTETNKKKWTVMVYMAAAKEDEQTELAAIRDLRELERVGSTPDIDVVVQLDRSWPGYPERYHVEKGVSHQIGGDAGPTRQSARSSSGNPTALFDFLTWSRATYPAERYLLVLWGHAYGLGFGRDHGDALTLQELANVLRAFGEHGQLDLLGTNACAMGYAEAAFELHEVARYLVASEITMPFAGWPYTRILQRIGQNPTMGPRQAGTLIIDEFMSSFDGKGVSLTLLDLAKAKQLPVHVGRLSQALAEGISSGGADGPIVDAFLDSAHGDVRPLVDLFDLCSNLEAVTDRSIASAASELRGHLKPGSTQLIVKHAADADFEGLHGLGIFVPAVTSGADLKRLEVEEEDYAALALNRRPENSWARVMYHDLAVLLRSANATIAELVAQTGASSRDDRAGVAQLLVGVGRSFAKLENAVTTVESQVMRALDNPTAAAPGPTPTRVAGAGNSSPLFLRLMVEDEPKSGVEQRKLQPVLRRAASRKSVMLSLRNLEDVLAASERTMRRALTNGRLGLGAGDAPFKVGLGVELASGGPFKLGLGPGDAPFKLGLGPGDAPFKPGLGDVDDPFKPGFGDVDDPFKPGFGDVDDPFKPGFGDVDDPFKVGFGVTADGVVATGSMVGVVGLFKLVAMALRGLERALAGLEKTVLGANFGPNMSVEEARYRTLEETKRAFRGLRDQIVGARETSLWVVRHPTQGLGPSASGANSAGRLHLASVGGLSSRYLRLL